MGWAIKNPLILLGIIAVIGAVLFQLGKDFFNPGASVYPEVTQESPVQNADIAEHAVETLAPSSPVASTSPSASPAVPTKKPANSKTPAPRVEVKVFYEATPECDYAAMVRDRFTVDTGDSFATPADCKGFFEYTYYTPGTYTLKYLRNGVVEASATIDLQDEGKFKTTPMVYRYPIFLMDATGPSGEYGRYTETDAIHKAVIYWQIPSTEITGFDYYRTASSTAPGYAWFLKAPERLDRTHCPDKGNLTGFSTPVLEVNALTGEIYESFECKYRSVIFD